MKLPFQHYRIALLVPCYNEAATVERALEAAQQPGSDQVQLNQILAGPPGRAPDLTQPPLVRCGPLRHRVRPYSTTCTPFQKAMRSVISFAASFGVG